MLNGNAVVQGQPRVGRYLHRVPRIHQGPFDRRMGQAQGVTKLVNCHGEHTGAIFGYCALVRRPDFVGVKVGVTATPTPGKEGVG